MPKGSSRKGCNNIDDKTKEIALALLATNMSVPRVAERLNLKVSTVKGWKLKALAKEKAIEEGKITDDGELKLNETRLKNKQNFVNNAWKFQTIEYRYCTYTTFQNSLPIPHIKNPVS